MEVSLFVLEAGALPLPLGDAPPPPTPDKSIFDRVEFMEEAATPAPVWLAPFTFTISPPPSFLAMELFSLLLSALLTLSPCFNGNGGCGGTARLAIKRRDNFLKMT
jgi:hypothetical protein